MELCDTVRSVCSRQYYCVSLPKGVSLTADWQRIANPGYNADRGPASFYALRLHWEN